MIDERVTLLDHLRYLATMPRHQRRVQCWALASRFSLRLSGWIGKRYAQAMVDSLHISAGQTPFVMTDSFVGAVTRRLEEIARQ